MRKRTIEEQRRQHGRKVVAVLPVHYPKEILTAMDILAVELWGPPGPPRGPEAGRIQTYVCAVARNALAFLAGGHADVVDGVLFPHTCDSIQGLATLAPDFGGWGKATFRYFHPKGEDRPSARALVRSELEALAQALAGLTGRPLERDALSKAVKLHREIDRLRGGLIERRRFLEMDDRSLYALLRRGEFLWPEDHLVELREAAARLGPEPVKNGVPIMVTGYVPEPASLLDHLSAAGALIVADDYAAVGRRIVPSAGDVPADPFEALVERSFAAPPCPMRSASQPRRLVHLEGLFKRSGAAGALIHVQKFCEPELFDVPAIRQRFSEMGVPVLYLEGELESELSGQTVTRLEAFVEMVAGRAERR